MQILVDTETNCYPIYAVIVSFLFYWLYSPVELGQRLKSQG